MFKKGKPNIKVVFILTILLVKCLGITTLVYASTHLYQQHEPQTLTKTQLKLVGKAQFSVLFWDIYQSRLYTPSGVFDGVKPAVLFEITYQKDITSKDLIERTVEQWQHLAVAENEYKPYIKSLTTLWPDITAGDQLALSVGDNESYFYFNKKYIGKIDGQGFSALFLDIWLSPKTSQPKLRQQLLGQTDQND
jgi:hypothetical protein